MDILEVSQKNADFWNELCGSSLAKSIGVADSSSESLKKFDRWYFDIYPYLYEHIPFQLMTGRIVLEIGLGYGTVAQRIAEAGAVYTGLDIALGPVAMTNHRLAQNNLPGRAVQGSILDPRLPECSFDYIVAIGCLHHTGDLKLAIENCYRLLKPGGELVFMVYYAYSYRRLRMAPVLTLKTFLRESLGYRGIVGGGSSRQRKAYDADFEGDAAPHTDWISETSLRSYCKEFSSFKSTVENIDNDFAFRLVPRRHLLNTRLPRWVGLDAYVTVTK